MWLCMYDVWKNWTIFILRFNWKNKTDNSYMHICELLVKRGHAFKNELIWPRVNLQRYNISQLDFVGKTNWLQSRPNTCVSVGWISNAFRSAVKYNTFHWNHLLIYILWSFVYLFHFTLSHYDGLFFSVLLTCDCR